MLYRPLVILALKMRSTIWFSLLVWTSVGVENDNPFYYQYGEGDYGYGMDNVVNHLVNQNQAYTVCTRNNIFFTRVRGSRSFG